MTRIKANRRYRLNPSSDTYDEFPAVARYGNTVCETMYFDKARYRWWVRVGVEVCYVHRRELVEYLGTLARPLTAYQAAMLRVCSRWVPLSAIRTARHNAGGNVSGMWDTSTLFPLLVYTESKVMTSTRRVTKGYAEKMGWPYEQLCGGDRLVLAERPHVRHGYLTREKSNGVWMYHITPLGRIMLKEYDANH